MLNRKENTQSKPETDRHWKCFSLPFLYKLLKKKINATCHLTECKISDFCGVMRFQLYETGILNEHRDHNSLRLVVLRHFPVFPVLESFKGWRISTTICLSQSNKMLMPGEGDGCIHHLCADFLFKFGQNSNGNLTTGIKHSQTDQLHFFLLPYRSNLSSKTNLYGACFFQGVFLTPLECIVQPSV